MEGVDEGEKKPGRNAPTGKNYPISVGRFARRIFSRRVLRSTSRISAARVLFPLALFSTFAICSVVVNSTGSITRWLHGRLHLQISTATILKYNFGDITS